MNAVAVGMNDATRSRIVGLCIMSASGEAVVVSWWVLDGGKEKRFWLRRGCAC